MATVLIANACRYTGPDAVSVLQGDANKGDASQGDANTCDANKVYCHDRSFSDQGQRQQFEADNPGVTALKAAEPEDAVAEVLYGDGGHAGDDAGGAAASIDVLVCNHFQLPEGQPLTETSADQFRQTLDTLLVEPYRFITAALPALRRSAAARIIMVTSAAPLRPGPTVSLYSAARAGANSMVVSLAKELGPDGIAVFGIAPNYFASDDTYSRAAFAKSERFRASVERNVPLGRLSNENEMARLIRYLAYDDCAFITGQVIAFTGGWS